MADEDEDWIYPEFLAVTYKDGTVEMTPIPQDLNETELSAFLMHLVQTGIQHENAVKIEIPPDISMTKEGYEDDDES